MKNRKDAVVRIRLSAKDKHLFQLVSEYKGLSFSSWALVILKRTARSQLKEKRENDKISAEERASRLK